MSGILQTVRGQVKKCPLLRSISQQSASENEVVQKIKIPARIHRGPTDILKALASTVKPDPTGAHYKYHDDPFLIPASSHNKRSFALSKESGRKAAQWVRKEHADLFQHKVALPFIPAYAPRAVYDDKSEVNEEVLKTLIRSTSVSDAILVYELLQKRNIDVSQETKQSLLELVSFHNSKDDFPEDLLEEKWYKTSKRAPAQKTWLDGGFADKLFESFEVRDAKAYCALIQGMAKYYQVNRAVALYEEMLEKKLPVSTETINALLRVSNAVKEGFNYRWEFIMSLLNEMKNQNCVPNLETLNSTLEAIASMATGKDASSNALNMIAEFRRLGIEPSLASYYQLLRIMYKRENATPSTLAEIVSHLENKHIEVRDPNDVAFFSAAMNICANKLEDVELAYRLNNILHFGDNYNLIGDSFKESMYYRNFFTLVCNLEPIQEVMKLYETLVPRIYTPEMSVMEHIINTVDMNGSVEYLPQLWSDIVLFEFSNKQQILTPFLDTLYKNSTQEAPVCDQLADIAWAVWNEIENQSEKRRIKLMWTGPMIGSVLQCILNAKRMDEAYQIFNKLRKSHYDISGVPEIYTLQTFCDAMIEKDDAYGALVCLNYTNEMGFSETYEMGEKISKSLVLNDTQKRELQQILETSKPIVKKEKKKASDKIKELEK